MFARRTTAKVLPCDQDRRTGSLRTIKRELRATHVFEQQIAISKSADARQKPRGNDPIGVHVVDVVHSDLSGVPIEASHALRILPATKKTPQFSAGEREVCLLSYSCFRSSNAPLSWFSPKSN